MPGYIFVPPNFATEGQHLDVRAMLGAPAIPTASWFDPIFPDGWDPVRNLDDPIFYVGMGVNLGRIAVLVAPYDVCLLDQANKQGRDCWTAPLSQTGYEWAHSGKTYPVIRDGQVVGQRVATLAAGLPHADAAAILGASRDGWPTQTSVQKRKAEFDDTSKAFGKVTYYDIPERGGIFAFGAFLPTATVQHALMAQASCLSGEWWPYRGLIESELLGSILVNEPGFRRDAVWLMNQARTMRTASYRAASIGGGITIGQWTPQYRMTDGRVRVRVAATLPPAGDFVSAQCHECVAPASLVVSVDGEHFPCCEGHWDVIMSGASSGAVTRSIATGEIVHRAPTAEEAACRPIAAAAVETGEPKGLVVVALPAFGQWTDEIEDAHCTLAYVPPEEQHGGVIGGMERWARLAAADERPFEAKTAGTGWIGADGASCVFLNSAELFRYAMALRGELDHTFGIRSKFPNPILHLTTGYDTAPLPQDPERTVVFDRLAVWLPSGSRVEFPFPTLTLQTAAPSGLILTSDGRIRVRATPKEVASNG